MHVSKYGVRVVTKKSCYCAITATYTTYSCGNTCPTLLIRKIFDRHALWICLNQLELVNGELEIAGWRQLAEELLAG
jgi:hypothetical protein